MIVALLRRNDFARLIFAVAAVFIAISMLPILLLAVHGIVTTPRFGQGERIFALVFVLFFALGLGWDALGRPCYVLLLSLTPFTRLKVYRRQVVDSLLLTSGRWKNPEADRAEQGGEKLYFIPGARYRLLLGVAWFILGILCIVLAFFGVMSENFLPAVYRLEFIRASDIVQRFEATPIAYAWGTVVKQILDVATALGVFFFGVFCFFVFGYFRTQWQRENIIVFKVPISQHMRTADILLLRSLKDDVKYVGRPTNSNLLMLPFNIYRWVFTFEQLIVDRLKYVGNVRLLDIKQDKRKLLKKWKQTKLGKFLGVALLRFLISIFPGVWYKLPAKGGLRYYIDTHEDKWKPEVGKAMSLARMVILVLGTTDSLKWEMARIAQLQCLEKTVFVMPPLVRKKNYRVRWQQFINYLSETRFIEGTTEESKSKTGSRSMCP